MTYTTIRHRGDLYAAELNDNGRVVRAVGPLHYTEARQASLEAFIHNAKPWEAEADGTWLQRELTQCLSSRGAGIIRRRIK